jgi:hypothetical protein
MNEQERKDFLERIAKLFSHGLSDADVADALAMDGYPIVSPFLNNRSGRPLIEAYISVIRDLMMDKREDEPVLAGLCKRCGTSLDKKGYCGDETCPHSDHLQDETWVEG